LDGNPDYLLGSGDEAERRPGSDHHGVARLAEPSGRDSVAAWFEPIALSFSADGVRE
jgi:hypothetical protein